MKNPLNKKYSFTELFTTGSEISAATQPTTKTIIQNVIHGTNPVANGAAIAAASNYLKNSQRTSKEIKGTQEYKREEAERLKVYARSKGLLTTAPSTKNKFNEGAEQKIYLVDKKNVIKVNDIPFYESWQDYFNSLLLHNYFFPITAYTLIGFTEKEVKGERILYAVVKQAFVEENEPTNLTEVKNTVAKIGFVNTRRQDYYNENLGIILEDLHDENVLTRNGVLYFVDTVFYLK